jgi:molybdopterin molybdotransferase
MPELFNVLPTGDALDLLRRQFPPRATTEEVSAAGALGRFLAEDLVAPGDLPSFVRSSMDGYAVRARDTFARPRACPPT